MRNATRNDRYNSIRMMCAHTNLTGRRNGGADRGAVTPIGKLCTQTHHPFSRFSVKLGRAMERFNNGSSLKARLRFRTYVLPPAATTTIGDMGAPRLLPIRRRRQHLEKFATKQRLFFLRDGDTNRFARKRSRHKYDPTVGRATQSIAANCQTDDVNVHGRSA